MTWITRRMVKVKGIVRENGTGSALQKKEYLYFPYSLFFVFGMSIIAACHPEGDRNDQLIIAVAANLQYAMEDIEKAFEAQSDIETEIIVGSSGKLAAQIQQGAPYDLLVSADMKYPQKLFELGYATSPPQVYASGTLILWTMKEFSLDSLPSLLQEPYIRKIALANPKIAPYGELAVQWMKYHNLLPELDFKLIYGESIAQTSQYISSGACDIGFTARSVIMSPGIKSKGKWISLKPEQRVAQGIIITKKGQRQFAKSKAFFNFIFSEQARTILTKHGYDTPKLDPTIE